MPDSDDKPTEFGIYARPQASSQRATEVFGAVLSVAWAGAVLAYVLSLPEGGPGGITGLIMTVLAIVLPLVLIWAALSTLRSVQALRDEAARLHATVDALRNAQVVAQQTEAVSQRPAERKADSPARQTETGQGTFSSRRDISLTVPSADRKAAFAAPPRTPVQAEEPTLALGTPAEDLRPPLSVADFIRALEFPESPQDKDGFRAMRLALEDRTVAKLIRAAQDVLTLLSQQGIYMDDLHPDRARPEVWRRFAAGERGRAIAALGGVRDRAALTLTAARMREDPVFRDAGHHFLRSFDRTFSAVEKTATDTDLSALADTRTARAFMLFGRVTGTFD